MLATDKALILRHKSTLPIFRHFHRYVFELLRHVNCRLSRQSKKVRVAHQSKMENAFLISRFRLIQISCYLNTYPLTILDLDDHYVDEGRKKKAHNPLLF
jgi:hypothetical protein